MEAVASTPPTSVAGKALAAMSKDAVVAVAENLQKTLHKDTHKSVKRSVLQVSPVWKLKLAYNLIYPDPLRICVIGTVCTKVCSKIRRAFEVQSCDGQ